MHGRQKIHRQILNGPGLAAASLRFHFNLARLRGCTGVLQIACGFAWLLLASPVIQAEQQNWDNLGDPVHSLLVEKESPVLRIHWSGELFVDVPLGDEPPGAEITLRRAKLKFHRTLGSDWRLKLTANYNKGGNLEVDDSYLVYTGWSNWLAKFGFLTPPFSLEGVSGPAALTFMEEALPVEALAERRSGGFSFTRRTDKSITSASLVALNPQQDGISGSGQALVLRHTHAPVDFAGRKGVNVGGGFSYRFNADPANTQFRSRPEIATSNTYFVDTGEIDGASKVLRAGLEASQVLGRFSWQSEIMAARVARDQQGTLKFWGAYVNASWFLTPDSRNYDLGQGQFVPQQVAKPLHSAGRGAIELAARASYVDLEDRDVNGGRQLNLSLGANWYLSDDLRFSINVVKVVEVNRPGGNYDQENPLILAVRGQWLIR